MTISNNFNNFCTNLRMSDTTTIKIQKRYREITKRINMDYWGTLSETNNSLYVGSYGRGTEIFTSDIDIVVNLPHSTYEKFNKYTGNGQSYLLSEVKGVLQNTYSTSHIKGDGQVICIKFSDGINFEIVPGFINNDYSSYTYPDTNNGGSWKKTDPRSEISALNDLNKATNKNLKRLCRMMRAWKANCNVPISGILIDTLAYKFIKDWAHRNESFYFYDYMSRDFFKYLKEIDKAQTQWLVPGSNRYIREYGNFQYKALLAYNKSLEAIKNQDYDSLSKQNWRDIYGPKFPR